jgi:tetratricopeptide (TPR) repeat protein
VVFRPSTCVLVLAMAGLVCVAPVRMRAQDATSQPGQKQPEYKDRGEYDLYDSITKDTNPATRLEKLEQWKAKYPNTDFIKQRRQIYLTTYVALNKVQDALDMAKEILADDPKDFTALYWTVELTPKLPAVTGKPATADALDQGEKAVNSLLNGGLDAQFAPDKKPGSVTDAQWKQARSDTEAAAHTTLGWVAWQRNQFDAAEAEFQKSLAIDPNNGDVAYYMGTVIGAQKKLERYPVALFYIARAAAYDGPGAMNAAGRKQLMDYITSAYTKYHGSKDGLDNLLQVAKTSATPPGDFKIESIADIEKARLAKEEAEAKANPMLALWKTLKDAVTAANGQEYFDSNVKGAALPGGANGVTEFKAKVVSMEPAARPKTVLVSIADPTGKVADAMLKFETPLATKADPGTDISFSGIADSFTKDPFTIAFVVDKKDLKGWPAPAPVHRRPAGRK